MILDEILKNLKKKSNNSAYTINGRSYSYSEFYKFVCNIYYFLLQNNPEKKPIVVYGSKEVYMKATFLACSFSGITYVPIDDSLPIKRVENIINQVKPKLIIGNFVNKELKNISQKEILQIMDDNSYKEIETIYLQPDDIYYIIFTSGSTGFPKGVKVTYKNLDSCINWLRNIVILENEVILNQANFSFDLSVADLYLSIVSGNEHFILENTSKFDLANIFSQLQDSNATLAVMTPSFAELLLLDKQFSERLLPHLKTIIFCGETLLKSTVVKLKDRFNNIKIINSYGPTECTFAVTSIEITDEVINKEIIPVGKAKDDVKIVILDKDGNELQDNENGEILIVGESVANGYLGDTKNESFIKYKGEKAYLTGDLGYLKDEVLYFSGRLDNQIKYKGYRIELTDIENNLYNMNYFEKVKVIAKKSKEGKITKLIAFVKLKLNISKNELDIKKDLRLKLPSYMCPNIKVIEDFPINNNGKTDINELRRKANER